MTDSPRFEDSRVEASRSVLIDVLTTTLPGAMVRVHREVRN